MGWERYNLALRLGALLVSVIQEQLARTCAAQSTLKAFPDTGRIFVRPCVIGEFTREIALMFAEN